ncbi:unnamed protein product [Scytosiphon promiscuus]
MMQWTELCLRLVLVLSVPSALGFVSPHHVLIRSQQQNNQAAASSPSAVRQQQPSSRRLLRPRCSGAQPPRQRCSYTGGLSPPALGALSFSAAALPSTNPLAAGAGSGHEQRASSYSNTALALAAGRGVQGDGGDSADGGKEGGWRQRMVRTIVSVFLRIRAVAAGVGSRVGLGRWIKVRAEQKMDVVSWCHAATCCCLLSHKRTVLLVVVLLMACATRLRASRVPSVTEVPMSTFMQVMDGKQGVGVVESVRVSKTGTMFFKMNGKQCYTLPLRVSREIFKVLSDSGVPFMATRTPPGLSAIFPVLYLFAIYFFVMKKGPGSIVGSTGKLASSTELDTSLTFGDVAGVDQAKSQVQELVSMIKDPAPFIAAGARLPSGLLMVGPPGTGKTLMARVMAAEAGVPFYYCSGSDFVEMYVGRGAARVRKLFVKAAKTAPCIIFLDELDALGKERSGVGGRQTNDEAEQTLNQLLASMDGLDTNNNGVMVIAATNRYEVLDNALTRPGRFDRIVRVDVPDAAGREAILKVHTRKMKVESLDVLRVVAELTPGLAGAELATIANEAAISAARRGSKQLIQTDFLDSVTNFYESRKKGVVGLQNMFKGMLT